MDHIVGFAMVNLLHGFRTIHWIGIDCSYHDLVGHFHGY